MLSRCLVCLEVIEDVNNYCHSYGECIFANHSIHMKQSNSYVMRGYSVPNISLYHDSFIKLPKKIKHLFIKLGFLSVKKNIFYLWGLEDLDFYMDKWNAYVITKT